jgi:hypothetical protein
MLCEMLAWENFILERFWMGMCVWGEGGRLKVCVFLWK